MRTKAKVALTGVVGAVATAALVVSAMPASADAPYPPLVGAGSDTTQFVLDGLSSVILDADGNRIINSIDAVNPVTGVPGGGQVVVNLDGPLFNRPNGSGAGLRALTASINPASLGGNLLWSGVDITDQVDFARSSSGPDTAHFPGTELTYIPFAKDKVSYAFKNTGTSSVPSNLSASDLHDIYNHTVTTYVGADSNTHTYVPYIPQANSGTRAFFLQQIGLTDSDVSWITNIVEENDGSAIDAVGKIVPFSVAAYTAQSNHKIPDTITANNVVLGSTQFARNVYNVVETARLSGVSDEDFLLQATFVGGSSSVCQETTVITTYGFSLLNPGAGDPTCGDISTFKSGYVWP